MGVLKINTFKNQNWFNSNHCTLGSNTKAFKTTQRLGIKEWALFVDLEIINNRHQFTFNKTVWYKNNYLTSTTTLSRAKVYYFPFKIKNILIEIK